ncbi:hypothetical protein [Streptomyces sp. AK02-01A]|uniref:hypothetical protein n=1 Tax=Streptomyces sp. AK02-01A TaxID=3028648 RepID=UPI0029B2A9B4|nr:hypothetical protein [Streptomyces sp. AK02-01A]MDX3855687.1 hypothetical protein [Streptomyces sp. AK02-01A]
MRVRIGKGEREDLLQRVTLATIQGVERRQQPGRPLLGSGGIQQINEAAAAT